MQLKMYFFVAFVRPCMHHNYGGISESHACFVAGVLWTNEENPGLRIINANHGVVQSVELERVTLALRSFGIKNSQPLQAFPSVQAVDSKGWAPLKLGLRQKGVNHLRRFRIRGVRQDTCNKPQIRNVCTSKFIRSATGLKLTSVTDFYPSTN